jgi:hypothetical protein
MMDMKNITKIWKIGYPWIPVILAILAILIAINWKGYTARDLHQPVTMENTARIAIWGSGLREVHTERETTPQETEKIVKWYNSASDFRENKEFAGPTPEAGAVIFLKDGTRINVIRTGGEETIEIQSKGKSYWAKQGEFRQFLDELTTRIGMQVILHYSI